MQIKEVNTKSLENDFITVNVLMNKSNKAYIRPLDNDINDIFNPNKNKAYQNGNAKRWVLVDENGNLIGRIAAFISSKYINKNTNYLTGGIGFFDCINNQNAANTLFNTAKDWLQQNGAEAMDGPINFGDRDKWWGLMVEGFNDEPVFGMPFNPAYYQNLFEQYGFKNYYNQYWYKMMVHDPLPARFKERYEKFAAKPDYYAKHADLKNLEKYAADFAKVYNTAWAQHGEGKEVTKEQILKLFNTMKPIMDVRVIWFAYFKDEPIAMFINIPDINQYIKYFNGKLNLLNKLKLLWMKKNRKHKRLTGLAFGVIPKFQALGVDSYIIQSCANLI
ncbi:MAG TPA: hypothetical protein PKJ70_07350, partial [Chitinophagaceae bacterium]|nr:hypothetical protein [Chitinophagaceae bacterium]